ncbi:MAG: methyltransferase domain-containing protein [Sandarakinorhabdus sp.]|nr:methyltransferase domain-containing protein [Sandarakinorhabdus sp.]
MTAIPACLGCGAPLTRTWVDLGDQPLANSNIRPENAAAPEASYPLHARVCDACLLVQVESVVPREAIFNEDYAYFSSFSDSWLAHCKAYAEAMTARFGLGPQSQVVEIASNDGYMLQYFVAAGVPVLGVEPSANTAEAAIAKGVATDISFFGLETARRLANAGHAADLLAAKNVLAHVPDINDFAAGIAALLKPEGVFTVEFPHLLRTIEGVQFDTIYHEHFTYLSLLAVENVFARHGLRVFDCEQYPTHGGSLRVFACRTGAGHALHPGVAAVRNAEIAAGLDGPAGYAGFDARCRAVRDGLNAFLAEAKTAGKTVAGYGAAAKGNTLLNYCGAGADAMLFIADRSPAKQGRLSPGSRIPIRPPEAIFEARPDYVLILPWNLRTEVMAQLAGILEWGGRFVTAVPALRID